MLCGIYFVLVKDIQKVVLLFFNYIKTSMETIPSSKSLTLAMTRLLYISVFGEVALQFIQCSPACRGKRQFKNTYGGGAGMCLVGKTGGLLLPAST